MQLNRQLGKQAKGKRQRDTLNGQQATGNGQEAKTGKRKEATRYNQEARGKTIKIIKQANRQEETRCQEAANTPVPMTMHRILWRAEQDLVDAGSRAEGRVQHDHLPMGHR